MYTTVKCVHGLQLTIILTTSSIVRNSHIFQRQTTQERFVMFGFATYLCKHTCLHPNIEEKALHIFFQDYNKAEIKSISKSEVISILLLLTNICTKDNFYFRNYWKNEVNQI